MNPDSLMPVEDFDYPGAPPPGHPGRNEKCQRYQRHQEENRDENINIHYFNLSFLLGEVSFLLIETHQLHKFITWCTGKESSSRERASIVQKIPPSPL